MVRLKVPMKWVEKRILTADSREMDMVLRAVISWQEQRYPEYELVVWSLPINNSQERKRQIDMMTSFLKQWDT